MTVIDDNEQIDDIEDIGKEAAKRRLNHIHVQRLKSRSQDKGYLIDDQTVDIDVDNDYLLSHRTDSFLPHKHKVMVKTWGCSHNNSDGEYMAGLLHEYGFQLVSDPNSADLLILNSCTVKTPSEDHFRNDVFKGLKQNQKVVVAGCVPQSAPKQPYLSNLSLIGVQQIDRVVEVVEETLKGNVVRLLATKKEGKRKTGGSSLHMPKVRRNPLIEIIPISTGCLNQCTYCKTRLARGKLGSYSINDIVERAVQSFNEGVKEIWLTSEDTGAYGRDIGTNLPELMYALIDVIPEDCRLRLGMTNPPYIVEHMDAMADILSNARIYSFLHIPVQSGSDSVLMDMKREYCIEDFCKIVDFLKCKIKGITIATDIICGFPTETDRDFELTMDLVHKYKFPSLFINQFFPRPGTPAAQMKRLANSVVKKRTKALSDLFASYEPYSQRIGSKQRILVTEESHDKKHFVGHNHFYEQILVPKRIELLGKIIDVEITAVGKHYMIGSPLIQNGFTKLVSRLTSRVTSDKLYMQSFWLYSSIVVLCSSLVFKFLSNNRFK